MVCRGNLTDAFVGTGPICSDQCLKMASVVGTILIDSHMYFNPVKVGHMGQSTTLTHSELLILMKNIPNTELTNTVLQHKVFSIENSGHHITPVCGRYYYTVRFRQETDSIILTAATTVVDLDICNTPNTTPCV